MFSIKDGKLFRNFRHCAKQLLRLFEIRVFTSRAGQVLLRHFFCFFLLFTPRPYLTNLSTQTTLTTQTIFFGNLGIFTKAGRLLRVGVTKQSPSILLYQYRKSDTFREKYRISIEIPLLESISVINLSISVFLHQKHHCCSHFRKRNNAGGAGGNR